MYLFMQASGLRSADSARLPTYPSRNPRKEIDFVLYGAGIEVRSLRVPRVPYSDHLPLVCDFALASPPAHPAPSATMAGS